MISNLEKFKQDLQQLIRLGDQLDLAMRLNLYSTEFKEQIKRVHKEKADDFIKSLPVFNSEYERWFSESILFLKQVLPDRVVNFIQYYEPPANRKSITVESYRVRDYLSGIQVRNGMGTVVVDQSAAHSQFAQQRAILASATVRFESSLIEIRQILQADLMDSEIEAAAHLAQYKFYRAAGAISGVVLERHLSQVCQDHQLAAGKKNPTINDFNELLKGSSIIDVPQWRFIQHLADIRNLCDHSKGGEPGEDQVLDMIAGTKKVLKTVY